MFFLLGFAFILFAILSRYSNLIPAPILAFVTHIIPRFLWFIAGFGFISLGQALFLTKSEYADEYKKNRNSNHSWKIPLISALGWILSLTGVYGLLVGVKFLPSIQNVMGLVVIFLSFCCYIFWYLFAHIKNRYPAILGLRIAMVAFVLSAISFLAWAWTQYIFLSLIFGVFGVISVIVSLALVPIEKEEQRGNWLRISCLLISVFILLFIGVHSLFVDKTHATLVNLGFVQQNLAGQIDNLAYSPDGKKIAFSQKLGKDWFLEVINPQNSDWTSFKVKASEDSFRPVFIENGSNILIDRVINGVRNITKIRVANGSLENITFSGIEKFSDGSPWSETRKEFLYVSRNSDKWELKTLSSLTGKSEILFESSDPILTPSWTTAGNVSYADSKSDRPYLFDLKTKTSNLILSDDEKIERFKDNTNLKNSLSVDEVIPAPDGFRYLYVTHDSKETPSSIWTVLSDGTKALKLYEAKGEIKNFSWNTDGQQIVFEENSKQMGFFEKNKNIMILDANLGETESLLLPQVSHYSPALSPDGVKIAFVGNQSLWNPLVGRSGIWVAVLR